MKKIYIFTIIPVCILVLFNVVGVVAEILPDYNNSSKVGVSMEIDSEKAVKLVKEYIMADEKLKNMCVLSKHKVIDSRSSYGDWEVRFPLKLKYGIGWFRRWAVFYVDAKTGEVRGGGQTPDL